MKLYLFEGHNESFRDKGGRLTDYGVLLNVHGKESGLKRDHQKRGRAVSSANSMIQIKIFWTEREKGKSSGQMKQKEMERKTKFHVKRREVDVKRSRKNSCSEPNERDVGKRRRV